MAELARVIDARPAKKWKLRLTPAEAAALRTDLVALLDRYRSHPAPDAPKGAEFVSLVTTGSAARTGLVAFAEMLPYVLVCAFAARCSTGSATGGWGCSATSPAR